MSVVETRVPLEVLSNCLSRVSFVIKFFLVNLYEWKYYYGESYPVSKRKYDAYLEDLCGRMVQEGRTKVPTRVPRP